jgi:hypothetical protein
LKMQLIVFNWWLINITTLNVWKYKCTIIEDTCRYQICWGGSSNPQYPHLSPFIVYKFRC